MHFQDSLLCKWKQGEKWNCPYHGTCDNQRNYRTVQLQAERYQGYLGCQGNRAIGKSKEAKKVNFALDNIKAQIAKNYQRLSDREAFVTAEMVRKYVAEFIKYQYKRSDMSMNELTEEFIRDYCLYLKNVVGLAQSSIWIYSIPLKHIVTAAHYNGKIPRNFR